MTTQSNRHTAAESEQNRENEYHMLLKHLGPQTAHELGGQPKADARRLYNLWKFNPMTVGYAVWYIKDEHDTRDILEQWLIENREALVAADTTQAALTYNLLGEYAEVWEEIKYDTEYDWLPSNISEPNNTPQAEVTCPRCDQPFRNLPNHLRTCDGKPESEETETETATE